MAKDTEATNVQIKKLERAEHVHQCAEFMANSDPWKTLHRTYEDGVAMLNDPAREIYVVLAAS